MRLYLAQHAEAKSKEEDPSRPLSENGWTTIRKVAKYSEKHLRIRVTEIIHSGKVRAKQTAEVLAKHLKPTKGITSSKYLEPLANPGFWKDRLTGKTKDIMLVGHLPHLSKLCGLLLTGNEDKETIGFKLGGIVCLERDEISRWITQWIVVPEIIP
jgi:phosphohistidine phosphatase